MQVYNDELYHYGKKGMKWGHRIAKPIMENKLGNKLANTVTNYHIKRQETKPERQEFKKEYRQMYKDQLRHPIHSLAAQAKLIKEQPLKALNMDLKTTKALNADVKRRVANDKKPKKSIEEHMKKGAEHAVKAIQLLKAANEKNQNQKKADELRKNGSGTSAAITEFASNVAYKTKADRILGK